MKKLMTVILLLAAAMLVGCSKASKYEKLLREVNAQIEKIPENDRKRLELKIRSEDKIRQKVEKFKKLSSDEQDLKIKEFEFLKSMIKKLPEELKKDEGLNAERKAKNESEYERILHEKAKILEKLGKKFSNDDIKKQLAEFKELTVSKQQSKIDMQKYELDNAQNALKMTKSMESFRKAQKYDNCLSDLVSLKEEMSGKSLSVGEVNKAMTEISKKVGLFEKMSPEEQDKKLKEVELQIENLKKMRIKAQK